MKRRTKKTIEQFPRTTLCLQTTQSYMYKGRYAFPLFITLRYEGKQEKQMKKYLGKLWC